MVAGIEGVCRPLGWGGGNIGVPCRTLRECAGGEYGYCRRLAGDPYDSGLCMIECTDDPGRCPAGSLCLPIEEPPIFGDRGARWCLKACATDDECPGEYVCIGARAWPPNVTACWL